MSLAREKTPTPCSRAGRILAVGLLAAWMAVYSLLAEGAVTASLDRNPVRMGESVRLIVTIEGGDNAGSLDTTPLEQDFTVLGTSTNSQISIAGGSRRAVTRLLVDLLPRREGIAVVPPLTIAGEMTSRIELEVLPAAAGGPGRDVFVEVEVEPRTAYVQSPVELAVKLYYRRPIINGNLADPRFDTAQVRRLGDDIHYGARRGGIDYSVIERRFAVLPQQSGHLRVAPIEFIGSLADDANSRFDRLFNRGRRVSASSRPVELEIKSPPPGAPDPWFPARDVSLVESWPDDGPAFVVGEPVTRTLRVTAAGVTGEQIPVVTAGNIEGIRHYPDKPVIETTLENDMLLGVREQSIAMVPSRAGSFTLPAVEVNWWDTREDRARTARLPARTVRVEPAPASTGAPTQTDGAAATRRVEPGGKAAGDSDSAVGVAASARGWIALAGVFASLWLLTCVLWWRDRRRRARPRRARGEQATESPSLRKACRHGTPGEIRAALMAWARTRWPDDPPRGLQELAGRLGEETLAAEFEQLDRACYAASAAPFDGAAFYRRLAPVVAPPARRRRARTQSLPPLYPDESLARR